MKASNILIGASASSSTMVGTLPSGVTSRKLSGTGMPNVSSR